MLICIIVQIIFNFFPGFFPSHLYSSFLTLLSFFSLYMYIIFSSVRSFYRANFHSSNQGIFSYILPSFLLFRLADLSIYYSFFAIFFLSIFFIFIKFLHSLAFCQQPCFFILLFLRNNCHKSSPNLPVSPLVQLFIFHFYANILGLFLSIHILNYLAAYEFDSIFMELLFIFLPSI